MSSRKNRLEQIEQAMAAHPKGLPLNEQGQLVPDPTPMAPPIGYRPQPSMIDIVRQQVLAVSQEAARAGFESEEEADDFNVGDDYTPSSPYELDEQSEVPVRVLKARADAAQEEYLNAKRSAGLRMQADSATPTPPKKPAEEGGEGGGSKDPPPPPPPGR